MVGLSPHYDFVGAGMTSRLHSFGDDPSDGRDVMAWWLLVLAGLFEVGWAIGLKYADGFTRFWPSLAPVAAMVVSLGLLGLAMKSLPVGTAYAVWVGVDPVGTVILASCCSTSRSMRCASAACC